METYVRNVYLLPAIFLMSGCASMITPEPSNNITLEAAMKSVGTGLREMREAQGDKLSGLIPSEVEIQFNISASATDTAKLELSKKAGFEGSTSASDTSSTSATEGTTTTSGSSTDSSSSKTTASAESKAELGTTVQGSRGNTITVKFVNIITLDKSKLAWVNEGTSLEDFKKELDRLDISTQSMGGRQFIPTDQVKKLFEFNQN
ncbi:MAG: hypothetical protein AB2795_19985 [Candidatus Thiodiazotropha endolucinida]